MTEKEKLIESIENHQAGIIRDLEALEAGNTTAADLEGLLENQTSIVSDLEAMMKED